MKNSDYYDRQKELTKELLEIRTPDKFTSEKQKQVFLNGTNALDWLNIATDGNYKLEVKEISYKFEYIPWINSKDISDIGHLVVLVAKSVISLMIPVLSPYPKEGCGCNTTFIEPGSNMTTWENGIKQYKIREITDCNTTVLKSIDTTIKGAETDGIKRALRKFGPGSDLYPRSETRNGNESNKDSPPILYLKGINIIKDIMGWSTDEMAKIASELARNTIEPNDIGTDPDTQRKVYHLIREYYIKGDMWIKLGEKDVIDTDKK